MVDNDDGKIHIDEEKVSGGSKEGVVRWVLGIGLLLAIVLLSIIWIIPALTQGDAEEEATMTGTMEARGAPIGTDTDGIIEEAPGDEGVAEEPAANDEVVSTEQE
ncbi:hypothetical protein KYN89_13055 [Alteriqipengyuania sp. NZ-12B]|uniref:SPOR domain-containing protein n=1 Tax=Alteriqipengyuania abyssalis TaxID=2860200 RepID=A0ABS7PJG5_9SPHN|nr:hypothetical protein [Alteriqipengyuania abyssalis]MBY8337972.1 hypothetical protein [Alteriqipengyuania abyssalis]